MVLERKPGVDPCAPIVRLYQAYVEAFVMRRMFLVFNDRQIRQRLCRQIETFTFKFRCGGTITHQYHNVMSKASYDSLHVTGDQRQTWQTKDTSAAERVESSKGLSFHAKTANGYLMLQMTRS